MTGVPGPRYGTVEGVRDLLSRTFTEDVEALEDVEPVEDDTAAGLPESTLVRRLRTAANTVDVALAPYYSTPWVAGSQPGIVDDLTEAVAAYLATLSHRQSEEIEKDDPVRLRYEWASGVFEALAAGRMELPGEDRKDNPVAGHGTALTPVQPFVGSMFRPSDLGLQPGRRCDGYGWDVL